MIEYAREEAEKYLRFKLGDRKGCDVLGNGEEIDAEIIEELAQIIENYANWHNEQDTIWKALRLKCKLKCKL